MNDDDMADPTRLLRLAAWASFHPDAGVRAARAQLLHARERARKAAVAAAVAEAAVSAAEARWQLQVAAKGLH